eukprot:3245701-Prymnesium_polylepis.1
MPRRLLAARTPVCSMQPGLLPPRVLSPDPVTTPGTGVPRPRGMRAGGAPDVTARARPAASTT